MGNDTGMSDEQRLKSIRDRIDGLDERIQALISQRAAAAKEVAGIKLSENTQAQFYRPERESRSAALSPLLSWQ